LAGGGIVDACFSRRTSHVPLASRTRWSGSGSPCSSSASPARTYAAFTAGGGVLVGWSLLIVAAALMITLGTIEAVRLRRLARAASAE
jgi:hypothetical protein